MYDKLLGDYELEKTNFLDKNIQKHSINNFGDLFIDGYSYDNSFYKQNDKVLIDLLGSDKEVSPVPPLEDNKKVEGNEIKIFTPKQTINRTSSIISTNNSWK